MNNKKEKIKMKTFWLRLWSLLIPSQKQMKTLVCLTVVFEFSRLAGPYILKLIIDLITNFKVGNINDILFLGVALFASGELVSLISYFLDKKIASVLIDIEEYLPVNALKKMLFLSLNYHEKENTGNKISKVDRGVDKVIDLFSSFFWDVVPTVIQTILTTVILFFVDYRFGLMFLFFVPIFVTLGLKANKTVYPYRKKRQDSYEESSGKMTQAIININTVKSFVQEKREQKEYNSIRKKISSDSLKECAMLFKYNWGKNAVIDLGRIFILFLGVYFVYIGNMTIGSLIFVITISDKALISLLRISRLYDRIMDSEEAINRLYFLNKEKIDIKTSKNGIKPKKIIGNIEFKNVDFTYNIKGVKALNKVNVRINSGCITALVGPSGGGKTTVARMVYRHYDPQKGDIMIDDKNLRDYDLYAFRKHIAIVPQEVEIFNVSVENNISYARPSASFREVEVAARIANAEEFIKKLPNGYKTDVGERGVKLSGGQRQRIGIARAVLANPSILIFDEATSSLDSQSEKLIQDAMDKISKNRTMIIIAHRLSTIKKADKIIVLEAGKVVEHGSHLELAKMKSGLYFKLLKLQETGAVGN